MKKIVIIFRNRPVDRPEDDFVLCTYIIAENCEEKKGEDMKKVLSCRNINEQPIALPFFPQDMKELGGGTASF